MDYGLSLIKAAFKAKIEEQELKALTLQDELLEKESCIDKLEEKLAALRKEIADINIENEELSEENEKTKEMYKELQKENKKLVSVRPPIPLSLKVPITYKRKVNHAAHNSLNKSFTRSSSISERNLKSNKAALNSSFEVDKLKSAPDGKFFFTLIKDRLSPKQFKEFIDQVKKFYKKEITKIELVEYAESLFGEENKDLLEGFQVMLFT